MQIETNRLRSYTFGPYIDREVIDHFCFKSIVQGTDGFVSGLFHNALGRRFPYFSKLGVTCESSHPAIARKTMVPKTPFLPNRPQHGTPNSSWHMSEASLDSCHGIRLCVDDRQESHRCMGFLTCYSNDSQESLGQIRWDLTITDTISPDQVQFRNHLMDHKYRVRWRLLPGRGGCEDQEEWKALPSGGKIGWWFSRHGERIEIA